MAAIASTGAVSGVDAGKKQQRTYPLMSRREVEGLIAEGRSIVIVNQHVLKIDAWIKYHPGGHLAIAHMVGRDATDEVTVLHSPEAQQMMLKYRIGRIEGRWTNFTPPIQHGKFRKVCDGGDDDMEQEGASSPSPSSHDSSRSASPVFDVLERNTTGLRARNAKARAGSVTSVSSVASEEEQYTDGMDFLASETRRKISLDLALYPALDPLTQDDIVHKYREMHKRIRAAGLFNCNYTAYAIECTRYTLFFCTSMLFLHWGWYIPSAIFLGIFWHQLVFSAHDAGHMGITHDFQTDSIIGMVIANWLGGLSLGWWKKSHNVHHIVTNSPEHDSDIQHLPFFAISHRLLGNLRSTYYERIIQFDAAAKFLIPFQAYTYYIIMLFARFNLYALSWDHILMSRGPKHGIAWWHRWFELTGQVFFWIWFGYGVMYKSIDGNWNRIFFLIISHAVTAPLHIQITLSHFAMSTADLGPAESFPQKMLRTTMDVDCPQWLDFFHGGLQFQAIHHLYPRIPRHNLRATQKIVQEFCNEVGIPYALYGFVDGNKKTVGRLAEVSRQAAILAKCQQSLALGDEHGHHVHH